MCLVFLTLGYLMELTFGYNDLGPYIGYLSCPTRVSLNLANTSERASGANHTALPVCRISSGTHITNDIWNHVTCVKAGYFLIDKETRNLYICTLWKWIYMRKVAWGQTVIHLIWPLKWEVKQLFTWYGPF